MRMFILSLLLLSNTGFSTILESSTVTIPYKAIKVEVIKETNHKTNYNIVVPKRKLGKRESSGNWKIINSCGYMGIYQFGKDALKATGFGHISVEEFRKNPNIWPPEEQEKAMSRLLAINKRALKDYIVKYQGDTIKGIVITEAGLLAAAHLAGTGSIKKQNGVKWFLETKGQYDPKDKNGTRLSDYLREFAE